MDDMPDDRIDGSRVDARGHLLEVLRNCGFDPDGPDAQQITVSKDALMACLSSGQQATAGRITAYQVDPHAPPIAKAPVHRDWMDHARDRNPYRCLPLVIGNQLGWDLLNPAEFTARWSGTPDIRGVTI